MSAATTHAVTVEAAAISTATAGLIPPIVSSAERESRQREVAAALSKLLPVGCVLTRSEDTLAYECDALTAYRQIPLVVALPETEEHVAAVLRTCHALGVPVVARGAGTGLSGGALPHALGVTLSLAKFNRIVDVDAKARTATVQSGVRNLAISEAALSFGLYYAPDPSSQIACSIGGNVAENSGGVHCLKYGLTLHNILRVRGFTVAGEPIEFGSLGPDAPGLDLLSLIVGSEGMLAVTVEVTVKLLPRPQLARCIMASFGTVESAGDAVAAVIASGIIPAGLELMDKRMTAAVEDFVHAGYDLDAAAILLCESDGTEDEVAEEIERTIAVLNEHGATRIEISRDEAQRLKFWSGRKNAFPASGRISPDYMCMDSTIPRKRLAEMLRAIEVMEGKYGLRCVNVFHAGDGNLHPLILFDANDAAELHRCEAFGADILETSIRLGGTVTGEHGVGVEKLNSMCVQFSAAEREHMLAVKRAFDPVELLNPGKVIPSLHRCAEYGRVHVHHGLLNFPRLAEILMNARSAALRRLTDRVLAAGAARASLSIRGGGTKDFYGGVSRGETLDVSDLAGISSYEPSELVVTALAGTPLAELESTLAEGGQCLPFEPPRFAPGGTVGGMVAAGLAGPARCRAGGLRDYVLGASLLNGSGETLTFGGQVMKNVAGYDVSRVLAGSMGILGVLCEVSLKVMPVSAASLTLGFDCDEAAALDLVNRWAGLPLPLCSTSWYRGRLHVRFAGARSAVARVQERLGRSVLDAAAADAWWRDLRDQRHPFFDLTASASAGGAGEEALWRLSVPDTTRPLAFGDGLDGHESFIEWGGAQRWVRSRLPAARIREAVSAVGGHATLFRAKDKSAGVFTPLAEPLMAVHRRLKEAFDPSGIFNPGRLYSEL